MWHAVKCLDGKTMVEGGAAARMLFIVSTQFRPSEIGTLFLVEPKSNGKAKGNLHALQGCRVKAKHGLTAELFND